MKLENPKSQYEAFFLELIKEKIELTFYSTKNIYKRLDTLSILIEKEDKSKEEEVLIEKAVWIYYSAYYFDYANPLKDISALLKNWNEDSNSEILNLLNSIDSKKEKSDIEKIYSDTLNSFWADRKLKNRLLEQKKDDKNYLGEINDEEWIGKKKTEMEIHSYETISAKEILTIPKKENYKVIRKMLKNLENEKDTFLQEELQIDADQLKDLKKKLKKAEGKSERGIETMYRLASRNLYTRVKVLDSKSSILLTVNSIILSVVLGTLYSQINEDPHLIIPVSILFLTNLGSIAYAIVSSRPILGAGKFLRDDVKNKKASLLNFDDYHAVSLEDYEWAMDSVMEDSEYLYHTITRDLYHMGKRMHFKYRNLKIAYNIFLWGLILSIVLFMACHIFFDFS